MCEHTEQEQWSAFLADLYRTTEGQWFKAADVAPKMTSADGMPEEMIYAWYLVQSGHRPDFTKSFGKLIGARVGRTFGEYVIKCVPSPKKGHLYKIEKV